MSTFDNYAEKKKTQILWQQRFDLKDCEGLHNKRDHRLLLRFAKEVKVMLFDFDFYYFC